ncbi:NAD(P)-binding protein [Xylaria acuta]|nr:NAD(P)-binding protein [Xylaria acuta]
MRGAEILYVYLDVINIVRRSFVPNARHQPSLTLQSRTSKLIGPETITSSSTSITLEKLSTMLGSSNTFDPDTDIPDLGGRVYVLTGGSAGIGYGIAAHILQHNCAKLYLIGKKEEHLAEAHDSLRKYGDVSCVELIRCELEDLRQTHEVAQRLASQLQRLDALILNAGLGVGPYGETKNGLDSHMQVNVIAQHDLAKTLLPTLVATPDSRLCFQASDVHRFGTSGVEFRDVNELNSDIGPTSLYARSKLAQVLLCRALYRRKMRGELGLAPGRGPWINATHPGAVVTDQQDQAVEAYGALGKIGVRAARPFMKDPMDEGCRPMLFAATSDAVVAEKIDGAYIVPDRKATDPSTQAQDEELQERCWNLVEDILKQKLGVS